MGVSSWGRLDWGYFLFLSLARLPIPPLSHGIYYSVQRLTSHVEGSQGMCGITVEAQAVGISSSPHIPMSPGLTTAPENARSALGCDGSTPPWIKLEQGDQGGIKPRQSMMLSAQSFS